MKNKILNRFTLLGAAFNGEVPFYYAILSMIPYAIFKYFLYGKFGEMTGLVDILDWEGQSLNYEIMVKDQYHAKKFLREDSIIFDAGANWGIFSKLAATLSPKGAVYSFEPAPASFEKLRKQSEKFPNIHPFHSALGKGNAEGNILVLYPADAGGNRMADSPMGPMKGAVSTPVAITSIDETVKKKNIQHVDFIKIDTEGYERNILEGARETIKKWGPVISMSAYHLPTDKDELPKLIRSIRPDYICELHQDVEEDFVCYVKGSEPRA